jgi:hypothetical protein
MATTKKKKNKKAKGHLYRNAVTPPSRRKPPRAVVVQPGGPSASDLQEFEETTVFKKNYNTPGWNALKVATGALATTLAGAYVAQQDWIPPKVLTGLVSGLGLVLALEGPDKWKSLGLGAMSAAGGQLGFMLIDDQLIKSTDDSDKSDKGKSDKDKTASTDSKPATPAPAKRQAGDIPADALARAYERARLRMALTSDRAN